MPFSETELKFIDRVYLVDRRSAPIACLMVVTVPGGDSEVHPTLGDV